MFQGESGAAVRQKTWCILTDEKEIFPLLGSVHNVHVVPRSELKKASSERYKVIIVRAEEDLDDLPDELRAIRNAKPSLLILGVTTGSLDGRAGSARRARFIESGGDYLARKTDKDELLAVIRARMKLTETIQSAALKTIPLCNGRVVVDMHAERLMVDGKNIKLTPNQTRILMRVAHTFGAVVPLDEVKLAVYGVTEEAKRRSMSVQICLLRQRLDDAYTDLRKCIKTVKREGIVLVDPHV